MSVIYRKTAKAQELLKQNRTGLTAIQRRLLILVDGTKDVPALIEKYRAFGMDQAALDDLAALGLLNRMALPEFVNTMPEHFLRVHTQTLRAWAGGR